MYAAKRSYFKPALFIFALTAIFLAACTGDIGSNDWPGLTAHESTVYVSFGPGVMAVDIAERRELWRFPAEPEGQVLFFASPEIAGDRLYFGDYGASGGFLSPGVTVSVYALENLDTANPALAWQNDQAAGDRIIAQPLAADDRVYVGTADDVVFALDADNGEVLWSFLTEQAIWGQPTLVDGRVYVASMDRSLYALDAADGSELWKKTFDGALAGKPTVVGDRVYIGGFDSMVHALEAGTGDEIWSYQAEDWVWSGPAYVDGVVYFGSSAGEVVALDADNGDVLWQFMVNGSVKSQPLVHDGVVYAAAVADESALPGQLVALDAGTGDLIWDKSTPASIFNTPVVVGESLVAPVQSETALLLMFELATGDLQWEFLPES